MMSVLTAGRAVRMSPSFWPAISTARSACRGGGLVQQVLIQGIRRRPATHELSPTASQETCRGSVGIRHAGWNGILMGQPFRLTPVQVHPDDRGRGG